MSRIAAFSPFFRQYQIQLAAPPAAAITIGLGTITIRGFFRPETAYRFSIAFVSATGSHESVLNARLIHFCAIESIWIFSSAVIPPVALFFSRLIVIAFSFVDEKNLNLNHSAVNKIILYISTPLQNYFSSKLSASLATASSCSLVSPVRSTLELTSPECSTFCLSPNLAATFAM